MGFRRTLQLTLTPIMLLIGEIFVTDKPELVPSAPYVAAQGPVEDSLYISPFGTSTPYLQVQVQMTTVAHQDKDQVAYVQSVSSHSDKEKSAITTDIASYVSGDAEGKLEPRVYQHR